ncbi:hypothetical protein QBC47DRAFT_414881 [Echria macrotheca]|uniref:C2H2-type domain-containing protein n=1 Tax=Echria macrotheca TaxID=438768 RepID=A0AAJ0BDN7_9PEZI|nr:hypothetical protein QBC47DRAFT_414881 [Echria macrotheca]
METYSPHSGNFSGHTGTSRRIAADSRNRPTTGHGPNTGQRRKGRSRKLDNGQDDEDGDNDDDDDRDRDYQSSRRRETAHEGQSFACPFYKADPVTHRSCLRNTMKRICDVKSHIQRRHMPIQCPVCGVTFEGKQRLGDREHHINAQRCVQRDFVARPGLSQEKMNLLKNCGEANCSGTCYERRWYGIWYFIFPGSRKPATPYAGSEFQERMDLAATDVAGGNRIQEFANRFPVDRHEEIHEFSNSLIQRFRDYASRQEDARVTAVSPSSGSPFHQPHIAPASQLPAGQLAGYAPYHGQAYGQMDEWSTLQDNLLLTSLLSGSLENDALAGNIPDGPC